MEPGDENPGKEDRREKKEGIPREIVFSIQVVLFSPEFS